MFEQDKAYPVREVCPKMVWTDQDGVKWLWFEYDKSLPFDKSVLGFPDALLYNGDKYWYMSHDSDTGQVRYKESLGLPWHERYGGRPALVRAMRLH